MRSTDKNLFTSNYLPLLLAFGCFIGNSPKWAVPVFAWLGVALMLRFVRQVSWWRGLLFGTLAGFTAGMIANYQVMPFPLPMMATILLVASFLSMLPYLLDKWLAGRYPSFLSTLIFPAALTLLDFWAASNSPSGTWGNIAYTQYGFSPLFQLVSVTGIWGIGFLIYWFGTVANYVYERANTGGYYRGGLVIYGMLFLLAAGYGTIRLQLAKNSNAPVLTAAAITVENNSLLEKIYFGATGEQIDVPVDISLTEPVILEAQRGLAQFIAEPAAPRFAIVYDEAHLLLDQLFALSEEAIAEGAQLVAWSEGVLMTGQHREDEYITRAQAFAKKHQIYLYFPLETMLPGEVTPGQPHMENKILVIDPRGEIADIYFKNIPVPGEPSVPGDGRLDIIEAPQGRLSHAICFDADFPWLMDQLHEQAAQLVVIPSGNWRAINPYHTHMAIARAIENGTALLRPVSRGLSVATDAYGRILARDDYFADERHYLVAAIPMAEVHTLYARWGNWLVYVSFPLLALGIFGRWRGERTGSMQTRS